MYSLQVYGRAFVCPKGLWACTTQQRVRLARIQLLSFFFLLPVSEFVWKKSPVSRSWKPKVKTLAMTGNVFTLSYSLAHWMFTCCVQNQTSLPWRICDSESCSQYPSDQCESFFTNEKNTKKPPPKHKNTLTSSPALMQSELTLYIL